jgi:dTDP-4-dehydrorhamnose reductase
MTFVVTGAGGQLGSVIFRELVQRGQDPLGLVSPSGPAPAIGRCVRVDLTDVLAVTAAIESADAHVIIHTAAVASVAAAFDDPARARRVNATATYDLASLAMRIGARFVYISTDMVFDGERAPYREDDATGPLSAYGRTKLEGEAAARNNPDALILRLSLLYGVPAVERETTFVGQARALRRGEPLTLFSDEFRTPLALEDAASAVIRCAESSLSGVLHVAGPERLSRLDMGRLLASRLDVTNANLCPVSRMGTPTLEPRAFDLCLDCATYVDAFGVPAGRMMADALASMTFD